MHAFITLPGIGASGEDHWQTLWERGDSRFARFNPGSWDRPELSNWIEALDDSLPETPAMPVLVAHSLSCLLVAHWARRSTRDVAGALLVAVPDPAGPDFPIDAATFRDPPCVPLPFPTLMIASTNDPYATIAYSRATADAWGAGLIEIGALGHINASSGIGNWTQGRQLLAAFCAGLARFR